MPSLIYGFDGLTPDSGDRGESGALVISNMNPISGIYCPGPSMNPARAYATSGGNITGEVVAMHSHDELIFTAVKSGNKLYAGDVYGITLAQEEYEVTPTAGWTTTGDYSFQFASFGNKIFAAVPDNKLVYMNVNSFRSTPASVNFAFSSPVSGAFNPEAKFITGHGGHLVAAGITLGSSWNGLSGEYRNMVWWSGFDDPESFGSYQFTPQVQGSDYKFLYDTTGDITGLVSSGDHLYVFKENHIYIAEGPPFRFYLLASQTGTRCPNSLLHHNGWVYYMSHNGPARINASGEYQVLCNEKTKTTLNLSGYTTDLNDDAGISFASAYMYPFSFNGYSVPGTAAYRRVYTAISEQYGIVYFGYPSYLAAYPGESQADNWAQTPMVIMSYDLLSGNIGFTMPWASDQTGTPKVPWDEDTVISSTLDYTKGSRNAFTMTTLNYKPSKGKAKDVIVIGTTDETYGYADYTLAESTHALKYFYLDPTVFYGKNWSKYTRTEIGTKIIRPSKSKSRIERIRPIIRFGYNATRMQPHCTLATFSDPSVSGLDLYGSSSIVELGPYKASPTNVANVSVSDKITSDGSILFDGSVFGDEHMIIFGFHTEAGGGATAQADYVTTTGIMGLEIFYAEQGRESR